MIITEPTPPPQKKRNRNEEKVLQIACMRFFKNTYIELQPLYFAIVNETNKTSKEERIRGNIRRMSGVTEGVADTYLSIPKHGKAGLYIEFKTETGKQSDVQKEFQKAVESVGYQYEIVRSLEQFQNLIQYYLE